MKVTAVVKYNQFFEDYAGMMTGLFLVDQLETTGIQDFVDKVVVKAKDAEKIKRLELYAHGGQNNIDFGNDENLNELTPKVNIPKFAKLRPYMAPDGYFVLFVCGAGKHEGLLTELAKTLAVPVFANTGDVYPNRQLLTGKNVCASRDGKLSDTAENVFWMDKGANVTPAAAPPTAYDAKSYLPGTWSVTIGQWTGYFVFKADGTCAWQEQMKAAHPGTWKVDGTTVEWTYKDEPKGWERIFRATSPLATTVNGRVTVKEVPHGFFTMSKQ